MSIPQNFRRVEPTSGLPEVLSAEVCRQTIQILRDRNEAITEAELAERLTSVPDADSDVTESDRVDDLQIRLHHLHLPKLVDIGLIEWDRKAKTVSPTEHSVYDGYRPVSTVSAADRDSIATLPADDFEHQILDIIDSEDEPLTRETLAHELATAEANGQPTETLIEKYSINLHHRLLPKLEDADLLEYDPEAGIIRAQPI